MWGAIDIAKIFRDVKFLAGTLTFLASRFLPFRSWYRELGEPGVMRADVVAGITVAMLLIPQAMAYAQLAGLPVYVGLYAAFFPVMASGLMGSLRQLATGPTAIGSLLTLSVIGPLSGGDPILFLTLATILAIMVGTIQITLGMLSMGRLVVFLSHPVLLGFTNAAAITIVSSQIGNIFGVEKTTADASYQVLGNTLMAITEGFSTPTLLMASAALLVILFLQKYLPKVPAVLVAVLLTGLASWLFEYEKGSGGAVVGHVPMGLPSLQVPDINLSALSAMLTMSFVIVLTGFTEAISISKIAVARTRQKMNVDQLLIGQGSANVVSGLFQGYPVSGSFSRTALNLTTGARTGFSSIVTASVVGLVLAFLTSSLYHLPQATLAVVIMISVGSLVNIRPFLAVWRVQKLEGVIALITFATTIFSAPHIQYGIVTGVLLSLCLQIYRAMQPKTVVVSRNPDGFLADASQSLLQLCPKISLLRFNAPLHFANTEYFERKVLERVAAAPELRVMIIDAVAMNDVDSTGAEMLRRLVDTLHVSGIEFLVVRPQPRLQKILQRSGLTDHGLRHPLFRTREAALKHAWQFLKTDDKKCPLKSCKAQDFSACILQKKVPPKPSPEQEPDDQGNHRKEKKSLAAQ